VIDIGVPEGGPREVEIGSNGGRTVPARAGVLPLRDTVTFPEMMIPLNIGQERSVELINDVLRGDRSIAMVPRSRPPGPRTCTRSACSARSRG
jgi:ATP-dependent Lon protease